MIYYGKWILGEMVWKCHTIYNLENYILES